MESSQDILQEAHRRLPGQLEVLRRLIRNNSHADHADGVAACLDIVSGPLNRLGFSVQTLPAECADPRDASRFLSRVHLLAERSGSTPGRPTVLLVGHLDTVFPKDHSFQTLQEDSKQWCGPGASDMKGGIVTALLTLELLAASKGLDAADFRVFFVTDEEQGSPTASLLAPRAAEGADVAVCFEAARPCGGLVVARKGLTTARIEVRGTTGHAGIAHDTAVNAFTAAARVVVAAERIEQEVAGLTMSPGGMVEVSPAALNSVPDRAQFELEWRFVDALSGARAEALLRQRISAEAARSGADIQLHIMDRVPSMAQSGPAKALTETYLDAARTVGLNIEGVQTAGVGDINTIAGFGAACLDGTGPEGGGFHTEREFVVIDTIAQRAAMNAVALRRYMASCARKAS